VFNHLKRWRRVEGGKWKVEGREKREERREEEEGGRLCVRCEV